MVPPSSSGLSKFFVKALWSIQGCFSTFFSTSSIWNKSWVDWCSNPVKPIVPCRLSQELVSLSRSLSYKSKLRKEVKNIVHKIELPSPTFIQVRVLCVLRVSLCIHFLRVFSSDVCCSQYAQRILCGFIFSYIPSSLPRSWQNNSPFCPPKKNIECNISESNHKSRRFRKRTDFKMVTSETELPK